MLETVVVSDQISPLPDGDSQDQAMLSLNYSYVCLQILKQLVANQNIEPLPELTLDIANGLTPDISIFPKIKIQLNPFHDIPKFQECPILAIGVVSSS